MLGVNFETQDSWLKLYFIPWRTGGLRYASQWNNRLLTLSEVEVIQSCPSLCDPMEGIIQDILWARKLQFA